MKILPKIPVLLLVFMLNSRSVDGFIASIDEVRKALLDAFSGLADGLLNTLFPRSDQSGLPTDLPEATKRTLLLATHVFQRMGEARKPVFKQFVDFIASNQKVYDSERTVESRFNNYLNTLARIDELNRRADGLFGVTQFADLSRAEFLRQATGLKQVSQSEFNLQSLGGEVLFADTNSSRAKREMLPDEWDWERMGKVTPVKHQGGCGSCYTFGTLGAIEAQLLIHLGCRSDLSEQQLVDCSHQESYTYNNQCNGGTVPGTLDYIAKHGVARERDYPYQSGKTKLAGPCRRVNMFKRVRGFKQVADTEEALKQAIFKVGPTPTGIDVNDLQDYKGGIAAFRHNATWRVNHLVLAVGFGVENGRPFWKVKNSWGARWGERGYFRLERGSGQLKIGSHQYVPVM